MEDEEVSDHSKKGWVMGLAAIVVIGAVVFFVLSSQGEITGTSVYNDETLHSKESQNIGESKEFTLMTKSSGIEPSEIKVDVNDTVILKVSASGEKEGIEVPGYGIEENSIKGKIKEIKFKADKKGVFRFGCGSYCGKSTDEMEGRLIVE